MTDKDVKAKSLPAEIADFYDAIVEKAAALRLDAQRTIAGVKKEQAEMAIQLQQNLAEGKSLRKADFQKLMGEVIELRQAREKEILDMLAQFHQEEQAIAQGLKQLFSAGKQARLRDFQKFIVTTRRATKTRRAEIEEIAQASLAIRKSAEEAIAQFREEREEMVKSWQALAETMQTKRPPRTAARPKNTVSLPESSTAVPRATRPRKSATAKKQGEE